MTAPPPADPVHLRRSDTNERFVAFAFAGAEMMAETEPDGVITYATGAFRSKFARPPEAFVGTAVKQIVAPADHEAIEAALFLLALRGRLPPVMIRLSDAARTPMALAGIVLPANGRPMRLCLTFARPPDQSTDVLRRGSAQSFARQTEARMRAGTCAELCLLQVDAADGAAFQDLSALTQVLAMLAPHAPASEVAPGRYGVLGAEQADLDRLMEDCALTEALRCQGLDVNVTATRLGLTAAGLTGPQAVRALRHALGAFARDGVRGLGAAGVSSDLAGYMKLASRRADILRRVIRDTKFALAFQPIVTLSGRALHHHEALIRPRPIPDLPLAGPQEFVMLVEALGLADSLDLRIAGLACDHAIRARTPVAFNISGQSVQNASFRHHFIDALSRHPACDDGLVIVEMTETAEIEDLPEALLTAQALRGIGVPFCLDDFGAGAADMRLLRALSPNIVKLDGSYVPGIATASRERSFIAGMVEISRASGAAVVAERVETEQEAEILAGLGVEYGQGWLFGHPGELPSMQEGKASVLF